MARVSGCTANQVEHFALCQYRKTLYHLKPHFAEKIKLSCQIILISCIIAVSLEFFYGHLVAAQGHRGNGLRFI